MTRLAELGNPAENPGIHIVPAFTGLGAPWWDTARLAAAVAGMPWPPGSADADANRFEPRLDASRRADLMGRWHEAVTAAVASARQRAG